MTLRLLVVFLASFLVSCATSAPLPSEPVHLVVAATTDLHGWIEGHEEQVTDHEGRRLRSGGLDVLSAHVNALRKNHPGRVMLFDSGDLFQGTLASNLAEGEPVIRAYNKMEYDAVAVGNHEFDYGPRGEATVAKRPGDDPVGALRFNASIAQFPFLAANIREKSTGLPPSWAKPHILVRRAGVMVGVIGVITPDTPVVTTPSNVAHLTFDDPVAAIVRGSDELRRAGADVVIVLAHLGGICRDAGAVEDTSSCEMNSDLFRLARQLPFGGVDAIFGGHTHSRVRTVVNGIPLAEPAPLGRGLAVIDLWVDPAANRVVSEKTTIRPLVNICERVFEGTETCVASRDSKSGSRTVPRVFEGVSIVADRSIPPVLEPYLNRVSVKKREELGIRVAEPFTRDYGTESSLGDLITDALRSSVADADFAVINSGGIRADLTGPTVTFGDMFEVLPFDNFIAILRLSGEELYELMRLGTLGRQGILQVSGMRIVLDRSRDAELPLEKRNFVVSISDASGNPIDRSKTYTIATTDFVASGGDGLVSLIRSLRPEQITLLPERKLRDAVIAYLQQRSRHAALQPRIEGRIRYVGNAKPLHTR